MKPVAKDEATARELLDWLSKKFNIKPPNLIWDERNSRMGWNLHDFIRLGSTGYGDYTKTLIHEFSDVLADRRNHKATKHGKIFCETLFESYYYEFNEPEDERAKVELFCKKAMHCYRIRIDCAIDKIIERQGALHG